MLTTEDRLEIIANNQKHKDKGIKQAVADYVNGKYRMSYSNMRLGGYHDHFIISYLNTYTWLQSIFENYK